ncbi:MAG: hypothetical protein AB7I36_02040 [Rhodospirillaceae bacterium]
MKVSALGLASFVVLQASVSVAAEPADKRHPGAVALSQPGGVWTYKSFPQLTDLYISENDTQGRSNCEETCITAWPPLVAVEHEWGDKVGDWSVIKRADGQFQWAYKGQPVYMRYHDMPAGPYAKEIEGFHLLRP